MTGSNIIVICCYILSILLILTGALGVIVGFCKWDEATSHRGWVLSMYILLSFLLVDVGSSCSTYARQIAQMNLLDLVILLAVVIFAVFLTAKNEWTFVWKAVKKNLKHVDKNDTTQTWQRWMAVDRMKHNRYK